MLDTGIVTLGLLCLPLLQNPAAIEPLRPPADARPWDKWSARFQQSEGWIGGDGAYSVAVTPERTLWLYSDTWVGKVRDGKRTDATIVNNTIGVQEGHGDRATMQFFVRRGADGKPAAMIEPPDGAGWYWLQGGVAANGRLYLFLSHVERAGDGVFGFRQVGATLGVVDNPLADPTDWHIEQKKVPFVDFAGRRFLSYGAAIMPFGDDFYIYGTDETQADAERPNKKLVVARVKATSLDDFSAWRFFDGGHWQADFRRAAPITNGVANELSVTWQPGPKRFLLVYTENGLSEKILARVSPAPAGPWSAPTLLYECPEMSADANVFTYAAKAHASESRDDELLITYVANSFDFWQVARDARLYWPKGVRVRWNANGK
ncbi:MAG: DUF4185 domain-containing protein [Planctomycetaceae bacterium]